jgi:hypothetical protein
MAECQVTMETLLPIVSATVVCLVQPEYIRPTVLSPLPACTQPPSCPQLTHG